MCWALMAEIVNFSLCEESFLNQRIIQLLTEHIISKSEKLNLNPSKHSLLLTIQSSASVKPENLSNYV